MLAAVCGILVATLLAAAPGRALPTADTQAPTVAWTTPAEGATVARNVSATFTSSDDTGVATATVSVDGSTVAVYDRNNFEGGGIPSPQIYPLDTTAYANGPHTVSVRAVDATGNSATATRNLTFSNASLIASYGFDDGSGTILRDASGDSHFGVLAGGLGVTGWTAAGKLGTALSFDGVDDDVALNSLKTAYKNGFTLEAWVNKSTLRADEAIVGSWSFDTGGGPMLWVDGSTHYRLTFGNNFANYLDSGVVATPGTWQHVAGTWDGTTARVYVDGVEKASAVLPAAQVGDSANWKIGSYGTSVGFWDGRIDDVKIFRTARTGAEIASDMAGPPVDTSPPTQPGSFTVTGRTMSSISTSWTASGDNVGVKQYNFYVGGTKVASTTATSYIYTIVTCGTNYDLAVEAEDNAGNVSTRATLSTSTLPCPDTSAPTMPGSFAVTTRTATSISASWTTSTDNVGVKQYNLYRGTTKIASTTATSYTFDTLMCNTPYDLAVGAEDNAGNVSTQATLNASTLACPDTTPPTQPGTFQVTAKTANSVSVSWVVSTDNVAVKQYDVYRGGTKITAVTTTSYTFAALTCNSPYDLAVAAEDDAGNVSTQATLSVTTDACPPSAPPPPLAVYSFDELSGSSAGDGSGNGRGAVLRGGAAFTAAGKLNGGLGLDGVDGRAELPNLGTFYKTGFTLEAWVKKSSTRGDAAIVGSWNYADSGGPMLWVDLNGRFTLTLNRTLSQYLSSGRDVVPGEWHHVAGTYDGATARIYVDGVLAASKAFTGNVGNSTVWQVGAYGSLYGAFDGTLDEVRVYDKALAQTDVAADMAAGAPVPDAAPPPMPTGFNVTAKTRNTISTVWDPAPAGAGIVRYDLYRDDVYAGFTTGTTFTFTFDQLACGTTPTLAVEAHDAVGHFSPRATLVAATDPCDIASGLVARYSLNDATGLTAADASGGGHAGSLVGGVTWTLGQSAGAILLDGTTGRIDLPNLGTFYKTGFTLEAWVKRASEGSEMTIVGSWVFGDHGGPMLWIDGNGAEDHVRLTLGTGIKNYLDGTHLHPGDWHHVAGTYDGTTARLYVDKQLVASKTFTTNVGDSNSWRIGSYGADGSFGHFDGTIDGVAIYSRALAVDELAATSNG